MIIENPDTFKSWLTSILEPLCDADPAALAKYVYALVKKDKPLNELRDGMLDQLDVFLQHETKPFVDMLFKSLDSQEYLNCVVVEKPPSPPAEPATEEKEPDNNNHNGLPIQEPVGDIPEPPNGEDTRARHRLVVNRGARPAPPLIPHIPPVRAPPLEQTLVKVLPTELLEEPVDQPPRKRDRRAEFLRDKEERRRRRSHSRERRARPRRHPRDHDERRRPSPRLVSPSGRYRNRSPPPAITDRQNSRSKSPVPARERDHDRERDRLRVSRELERDRISRDRDHRDRLSLSRDRERSRDRSRERSRERSRDRGSLSPRDLRPDINDAFKRRCIDFDEKGYCMRGDLCKFDHGTDPLVLEDAALTRVLSVPPPVPEYNPLAPDIWCGAPGFAPYPPPRHPPRELVPIPRVRHEPPVPVPRHPPPHKKNFDYNRLGAPRPPLPANAANCSLEVKKVPRGMNDITHLNNHFSKFGKIVNIQVCFEGDPEAALITFSTPTEANVAYKSTEAVLNNRFIKVFWHNPENKQENMPPTQQQPKPPQPERQNNRLVSHNKVLINRDNIKASSDNRQLEKQQAKEASNGQPEPKKEVPKPLEKTKKVMDMSKRAQALLESQLQQQMLLIQKYESGKVTGQQKTELLDAINSAQEGIEKLRKELLAYNGTMKQMQANAKRPKTREEVEKEILDADLDMMTKQQEGQDVTELKKKIDEMRRQRDLLFPPHPAVRRPHSSYKLVNACHYAHDGVNVSPKEEISIDFTGGRFTSMNRFVRASASKVFSVNQSVDHRPRALLISGFESDELDALVQHFSQYGEVTNKEVNLAVPELVLQYRLRAHAELAAAKGRHYSDRTLSITWVANTKPMGGPSAAIEPRPTVHHNGESNEENKEAEPTQEASEDALLRFDEEEEEEAEEDRSWRR